MPSVALKDTWYPVNGYASTSDPVELLAPQSLGEVESGYQAPRSDSDALPANLSPAFTTACRAASFGAS